MNCIVNNPSRKVVIKNTNISQSANIVNRILANIGYEVISVDNSMANAYVWQVYHKSHISGFIDCRMVGTYSFQQQGNDLVLTVEVGKGLGAISDQWELQDCNTYLQQALSLAVKPNITYKQQIDNSSNGRLVLGFIGLFIVSIIIYYVVN